MILRAVIADDERPARSYLVSMLRKVDEVELVGEAASGPEAVKVIEETRPALALLDIQMPGLDGFEVVRMVKPECLPLVAFVTAHDEYAVQAFEMNAVDYLLKPIRAARLRETVARARERLEDATLRAEDAARIEAAAADYQKAAGGRLERIPVRRKDEVVLVPVKDVASVVADGELLRVTTVDSQRHVITYTLRDLEARLDPARFVRLSRGTLANLDLFKSVSLLPGGTQTVTLTNGQELKVSRTQARVLRDQLLRL
ncbi:MAG: LytTR family DNA-binding domain-containing protein [Vicinamibacterales bacterium]|jgi:two-component system LytT family response regulator|nr:hypothetical protein [Acidobacteriota bacterium]MDP6372254.1 LytTR family DNA-binding domain-containing protein [Vicinamibacterales bacterium]MDP6609487.1 LytTR family DNA-binding domain-containing protein [Vicinamibacterales bacterium]HAK57165.1 hypothetical protein [Acidobacteriota bacterium]|tara:strand:- start:14320 stop:15093 length:774 start_codon:yes stop_codon:yes gene_type:complete